MFRVFLLLRYKNLFGIGALSRNARLECGDRLHSHDHPLENYLLLQPKGVRFLINIRLLFVCWLQMIISIKSTFELRFGTLGGVGSLYKYLLLFVIIIINISETHIHLHSSYLAVLRILEAFIMQKLVILLICLTETATL